MPSHPNRGGGHSPCRAPTPEEIKLARQWAMLSQEQAARAVCSSLGTWQQWEADPSSAQHRRMHPAFWRLFLKEVGLDPDRPLRPQLEKP